MPKEKVNLPLKLEIIKHGFTQREVAKRAGMHESTLSHIINGFWNPSQGEKERIANALGVDVKSIFCCSREET